MFEKKKNISRFLFVFLEYVGCRMEFDATLECMLLFKDYGFGMAFVVTLECMLFEEYGFRMAFAATFECCVEDNGFGMVFAITLEYM